MLSNLICLGQAEGTAQGGGLQGMLPMVVIFGVMIFWMYRSQKKEQKKREALLSAIKAGDKVITAGGLMADVVSVKEASYIVKIAEKINVEISKNGIGTVVVEDTAEGK